MFGSSLPPVVCVLLCVLTFLAPCCDVRYDLHIIRMFGSSLPPVVCVLLCVLTFLAPCCDVRYDLHIITMFGSSLPPVVCRRARVQFMLYVFVWFVFTSSCLCSIMKTNQTSLLCVNHNEHHNTELRKSRHIIDDVWFVFTSSCLCSIMCLDFLSSVL
jgi:hypothetical protein